jgi:hypothetical protein
MAGAIRPGDQRGREVGLVQNLHHRGAEDTEKTNSLLLCDLCDFVIRNRTYFLSASASLRSFTSLTAPVVSQVARPNG